MVQLFNACEYLLDRRLAAGDAPRTALTGGAGDLSYAELHDQVCRTAAGLRSLGLQPEQRMLMLMADSPQFVVVYLAAMRIGAIPVPVSHHAARRRGGRAAARLPGPVPGRHPRVRAPAAARRRAAAAPELTGILADVAARPGGPVPVQPAR